jgi:hypothetical protein
VPHGIGEPDDEDGVCTVFVKPDLATLTDDPASPVFWRPTDAGNNQRGSN